MKYKITQDRWCWCGRAAALIVTADDKVVEPVCSESHGTQAIEWLRAGITKLPGDTKSTA